MQQDLLGKGSDAIENSLEDIQDLGWTIVSVADALKVEQTMALQVHRITTITSNLVILSGSSRPQKSSIGTSITSNVFKRFGMRPVGNGMPEM
jgi:ribosomal silencing factor RsfS